MMQPTFLLRGTSVLFLLLPLACKAKTNPPTETLAVDGTCPLDEGPPSMSLTANNPNTCVGTPSDIARIMQYGARSSGAATSSCERVRHTFKRHVSGEQCPGALDRQSWFPRGLAFNQLQVFLGRVQREGRNQPKDPSGALLMTFDFKVGCSAQIVESNPGQNVIPDTKVLKVVFNQRGDIITAFPYAPFGNPQNSPIVTE